MLGVFAINVYIGLYDKTLMKYNTPHVYLNWLIAIVDLVAAALLLAKPLDKVFAPLSGIVWPIVYMLLLAVDVSTRLCLFATTCWPSTQAAYDYLILGDASQGWVLWPYTMFTAITLLTATVVITAGGIIAQRETKPKKPDQPTGTLSAGTYSTDVPSST